MRAKKIYENINFERGSNPKHSMNLGSMRKLEPYSLKNAEDHFQMPIDHIYKILDESPEKIYLLGSISPGFWESSGIKKLKEILDPKYFNNRIYSNDFENTDKSKDELIHSKIGPIYIEKVGEEEGTYFWGTIETAINFKLWEFSWDWDEWCFNMKN
jgi:hypothetical protein